MAIAYNAQMEKEIKRYKRFMETENRFSYRYLHNGEFYFNVVYLRFNKAVGSIVLPAGPSASREDLIRADWAFFQFNRVITEARDQLLPDLKRPIYLLVDTKRDLTQAKGRPVFSLDPLSQQLETVFHAFDLGISAIPKLETIYESMQALEKRVLDRGYLTDDDVNAMGDLNISHYRTMYHQGRELIAALPALKAILDQITPLKGQLSGEDERLRHRLHTNLEALTREDSVSRLLKSNASFERDAEGRPVQMKPGEEGLLQYEENLRKKIEVIYQTKIMGNLRNLPQ